MIPPITAQDLRWAWLKDTVRQVQAALTEGRISHAEADTRRSNIALLAVFGTIGIRDAAGNIHVAVETFSGL
jgi:hypothetical protein